MTKVTDPNLLAQLEADESQQPRGLQESQDPLARHLGYILSQMDHGQNLMAGALAGTKGVMQMIPQIPESIEKQFNLGRPPIDVSKFDPYGMMGVKEQPIGTEAGMEQAIGQYLPELMTGAKTAEAIPHIASSTWKFLSPQAKVSGFMKDISKGQSLEQSAKTFAKNIKNTFEKVKSSAQKQYKDIFSRESPSTGKTIGESKIAENVDFIEKDTLKRFDPEIKRKYKDFNTHSTIENLHDLQSDIAAEERYYQRLINRGQATSEDKQIYGDLIDAKKLARNLIHKHLDKEIPGLSASYKNATTDWAKKVIPYTSDRNLRQIISKYDAVTNPPKSMLQNIFKYADEDTEKILMDLGPDAIKDVLYQAVGKQAKNIKSGEFPEQLERLEESGYERYISDELKKLKGQVSRREIAKTGLKYGLPIFGGSALGGIISKYLLRK